MVPWAAPSLGMKGARGRTDHVEAAYGHLYSSELLLVRRVQRVSVRVLERRLSGVLSAGNCGNPGECLAPCRMAFVCCPELGGGPSFSVALPRLLCSNMYPEHA